MLLGSGLLGFGQIGCHGDVVASGTGSDAVPSDTGAESLTEGEGESTGGVVDGCGTVMVGLALRDRRTDGHGTDTGSPPPVGHGGGVRTRLDRLGRLDGEVSPSGDGDAVTVTVADGDSASPHPAVPASIANAPAVMRVIARDHPTRTPFAHTVICVQAPRVTGEQSDKQGGFRVVTTQTRPGRRGGGGRWRTYPWIPNRETTHSGGLS
ncbi:hypothetical protein GCM10020220_046190 [Nonomuraea rubra]